MIIPEELPEPIIAICYLWTAPVSELTPSLWSFEEFLNERLHRWVAGNPEEYEYKGEFEYDAQRRLGTSSPWTDFIRNALALMNRDF
jgi:hypothetical protein